MMHGTIGILLGALVLQIFLPSSAIYTVKKFQVNLDDPPRERWKHVAKYWKRYLHAMGPAMEDRIGNRIGSDFGKWKDVAHTAYDAEYEEEMAGMMEAAGPGPLKLHHLKLNNLLYEMQLPTMCSGVLTATPDGTVIHGRNLDFAFPFWVKDKHTGVEHPKNWHDVTYDVTFLRGGQPLYTATMWPGFVGFSTAMRYPSSGGGGWSYQHNTRANNIAHWNLEAAGKGGQVTGLIVRRLMETVPDFHTAVSALYAANHMAPQYFAIAGPNPYEGAIVTVDRLGQHEIYTPPVNMMSMPTQKKKNGWYLVQTNDDQFNVPLDGRRPWTNKQLDATNRDSLSVDSMFHLMHTVPLLDGITVYTTVMVPKTGYYETILPWNNPPGAKGALGTCGACEQLQMVGQMQTAAVQHQQELMSMASRPVAIKLVAPTQQQIDQVAAARAAAEGQAELGRVRRDPSEGHNLRGTSLLETSLDATSFLQLSVVKDSASEVEL